MARYDIFVSYARKNQDRVTPLVQLLREKGFRVFFDQRELVLGVDFKQQLDKAVPASRALLLCWSSDAAESDYVRSELFRARGLNMPVLPWLLDRTDLPKLIEVQGINELEPQLVLERLRPRLGMQLRRWRLLQAAAILVVVAVAFLVDLWAHRPWTLEGEVRSASNEAPLQGVTVEVTTPANARFTGVTKDDGRFVIVIPRGGALWPDPVPKTVDVLFRENGFKSDHEPTVSTSGSYSELLVAK